MKVKNIELHESVSTQANCTRLVSETEALLYLCYACSGICKS